MSAFVMSQLDISKAVRFVTRHGPAHGCGYCNLNKVVHEFDPMFLAKPERFASQLYHMNVSAVCFRYEESEDEYADTFEYNTHVGDVTPIQAYKYLRCLSYQCDEGDVDTWPLFGLLTAMINELGACILLQSPQYDAAVWG